VRAGLGCGAFVSRLGSKLDGRNPGVIVRAAGGCPAVTSAAKLQRHGSIRVAVCASTAAMGRKAKPPTDRAAEQADYKTWLPAAVAELQRKHNINPGIIPVRIWRHLYIQGRFPQDAADQAAVSAYNAEPAAERLRKQ
jgi:hypothetical protein